MGGRALGVGLLMCGLIGCVYHIDSAIPDDLVRTSSVLLGTWYSENSSRVEISSTQCQTYRLEYRDSHGTKRSFYGRLGELGEHTVFEVWPAHADAEDTWPVGRLLFVLDVRGDEIRTSSLNIDSVGAALQREGDRFPHLVSQDDLILTASTHVLITQLKQYVNTAGFLTDKEVWRRAQKQ
jgi:hypothetical protein